MELLSEGYLDNNLLNLNSLNNIYSDTLPGTNRSFLALPYFNLPTNYTQTVASNNTSFLFPYTPLHTFIPNRLTFNIINTPNTISPCFFLFDSHPTTGRANNQIFVTRQYGNANIGDNHFNSVYYKNGADPISWPILKKGVRYWWLVHYTGSTSFMSCLLPANIIPLSLPTTTTTVPPNTSYTLPAGTALDLTWEKTSIPSYSSSNLAANRLPAIILRGNPI